MKKNSLSLISTRQLSVQETGYKIFSELWLRKWLPGIWIINTNIPENRIRMVKLKEELEVLSDDSTDVFKQNIFDRYMDRPKRESLHVCKMFV